MAWVHLMHPFKRTIANPMVHCWPESGVNLYCTQLRRALQSHMCTMVTHPPPLIACHSLAGKKLFSGRVKTRRGQTHDDEATLCGKLRSARVDVQCRTNTVLGHEVGTARSVLSQIIRTTLTSSMPSSINGKAMRQSWSFFLQRLG